MNARDMRARLIQQVRRCVLRILLEAYPHALEGESIFELVLEEHPELVESDLERDLAYLAEADKGYVETDGPTRGVCWGERKYKLTGKGNEIATRMDHDPALGI